MLGDETLTYARARPRAPTAWRTTCARLGVGAGGAWWASAWSARSELVVGAARRAQGGRRLRAARPGLPARAARLHAARTAGVAVLLTREALPDVLPAAGARRVALDADAARPSRPRAGRRRSPRSLPEQPRLRHLHLGLHRPAQGRRRSRTARCRNRLALDARRYDVGRERRACSRRRRVSFDVSVLRDLRPAARWARAWCWCAPRRQRDADGLLRPDRRSTASPSLHFAAVAAPRAAGARRLDAPAARCAAWSRAARRCRPTLRGPRCWPALPAAPGCYNRYGPTEATDRRRPAWTCRRGDRASAGARSAGRSPTPQVYVLDAAAAAGAAGRAGRALHRRRRPGARLPAPARADRGALRARPVRARRRARACTAPATWCAGAPTARWSSSAASTTR